MERISTELKSGRIVYDVNDRSLWKRGRTLKRYETLGGCYWLIYGKRVWEHYVIDVLWTEH